MKNQIRVALMVLVMSIGIVSTLFVITGWSQLGSGLNIDLQAIPYLQPGK